MKMARGHILLFFSTFLLYASPLHLGNYRRLELRALGKIKNGNLSDLDPNDQKSDLPERSQRAKENGTQSQTLVTGTYINCVINIDSKNQPHYDCKYSPDVNVNWTNTDGRLIGTMSTSFACAKRRSVRNKMQSPRNEVDGGTWKQLIRDKRRTVYRDDAEAEEAPTEAEEAPAEEEAQQIEEKENVVAEEEVVPKDEDIAEEDSKVPTDPEKETPDENNNGPPSDTAKEDENEIKDESDTADTEVPGKEDDVRQEEDDSKKGDNDDKVDQTDTVEGNDDKNATDKNCNKPDGSKCDAHVDYDSILVPIQEDIEALLSEPKMLHFTKFIEDLLYEAGDYLISLLVQNLQLKLREERIAEKFERKVEMLAQEHGNNTEKAIEILEKRIHEQLGKSYQLQILAFLTQLYDP